LSLTGHYWLKV